MTKLVPLTEQNLAKFTLLYSKTKEEPSGKKSEDWSKAFSRSNEHSHANLKQVKLNTSDNHGKQPTSRNKQPNTP